MPYHTFPVKLTPLERRTPPTFRFWTADDAWSGRVILTSEMKSKGAGCLKVGAAVVVVVVAERMTAMKDVMKSILTVCV